MLQHFGTAPSSAVSPVDENLILDEIERLLGSNWSESAQKHGSLAVPARRGVRPLSLMFAAGIAVAIAALMPIGLKKSGVIGSARQAMGDAARAPVSD